MGTIDLSTEALLLSTMVSYVIAACLLPLALGGMMHKDMMGMQGMQGMQGMKGMGQYGVQMEGMMQVGNMGRQMMGNQMMGNQMQGMNGGNWWGMTSEEDKEAYLKWCEERKLQMQEQEEAQKLLKQITQQAEEKKREAMHEKMMKEHKMKRENMVAQWRMWQNQLKQVEEYDESMEKYTEMKIKYMFSLTMDYLKFCKCSDNTADLQRYLSYGGMTYVPGMSEAYDLSELEGVDLNNEEAVAQRMATLPAQDQVKLYFTGMIMTTCDAVKTYINQLKQWETQYNFMGM